MEIKDVKLLTKIKFLKWLWVTLILSLLYDIPVTYLVIHTSNNTIRYVFGVSLIIGLFVTIYFSIKVISSQRLRVVDYVRYHNLISERNGKINKELLYKMSSSLCGQTLVNQICDDYNIENEY